MAMNYLYLRIISEYSHIFFFSTRSLDIFLGACLIYIQRIKQSRDRAEFVWQKKLSYK